MTRREQILARWMGGTVAVCGLLAVGGITASRPLTSLADQISRAKAEQTTLRGDLTRLDGVTSQWESLTAHALAPDASVLIAEAVEVQRQALVGAVADRAQGEPGQAAGGRRLGVGRGLEIDGGGTGDHQLFPGDAFLLGRAEDARRAEQGRWNRALAALMLPAGYRGSRACAALTRQRPCRNSPGNRQQA